MFYVYVLRCRDNSFYTGYTNDLKKRLTAHEKGKASKYTRSRLPVSLLKSWSFLGKSEAMKYEAAFKSLSRAEKMKKIKELSSF